MNELDWDYQMGYSKDSKAYKQGQKTRQRSLRKEQRYFEKDKLDGVPIWISNFKIGPHGVGVHQKTGTLYTYSNTNGSNGIWQKAKAMKANEAHFNTKTTLLVANELSRRAKAVLKRATMAGLFQASLEHAQALSGEVRMYETEEPPQTDPETGMPDLSSGFFNMLEELRQRDQTVLGDNYQKLAEMYKEHLYENIPLPLQEEKDDRVEEEGLLTPKAIVRKEVDEFVPSYMQLLNAMLLSTPFNAANIPPAACVSQQSITNEAMDGILMAQSEGSPRLLRIELMAKARDRKLESDRLVTVPSWWVFWAPLFFGIFCLCIFCVEVSVVSNSLLLFAEATVGARDLFAGQQLSYVLRDYVAYGIAVVVSAWTLRSALLSVFAAQFEMEATLYERKDAAVNSMYKAWNDPDCLHWSFLRRYAPNFIGRHLSWKPILANDLVEMKLSCSKILGTWTWRLAKLDMNEAIKRGSIGYTELQQLMWTLQGTQVDEKVTANMSARSNRKQATTAAREQKAKAKKKRYKKRAKRSKAAWRAYMIPVHLRQNMTARSRPGVPPKRSTAHGASTTTEQDMSNDFVVNNDSDNDEETAGWESDDTGSDGNGDGDGDESDGPNDEDNDETVETIKFPVSKLWMDSFCKLPVNQDDDDDDDNGTQKRTSRISAMQAGLARIASPEGLQAIASGAPPAASAAPSSPEPQEKRKGKQGKKKTVDDMFREAGYTLIRRKTHYIYRRIVQNRDGSHRKQTVTRSKTPRNQGNADKKTLADMKRHDRALADEGMQKI